MLSALVGIVAAELWFDWRLRMQSIRSYVALRGMLDALSSDASTGIERAPTRSADAILVRLQPPKLYYSACKPREAG